MLTGVSAEELQLFTSERYVNRCIKEMNEEFQSPEEEFSDYGNTETVMWRRLMVITLMNRFPVMKTIKSETTKFLVYHLVGHYKTVNLSFSHLKSERFLLLSTRTSQSFPYFWPLRRKLLFSLQLCWVFFRCLL